MIEFWDLQVSNKDEFIISLIMAEKKGDIKLVIVGDEACGKTCLIQTFAENNFPNLYIPTGKLIENCTLSFTNLSLTLN